MSILPEQIRPLAPASGSARSSEVEWYIGHCHRQYAREVTPLAVRLALAASSRGGAAHHDWVAENAMHFQSTLEQVPNAQAERLAANEKNV